jgi:uncharacterized protein (TIGR00730 family)
VDPVPGNGDEDLLEADHRDAESLRGDQERVARMSAELLSGFRALHGVRHGVTMFGSARVREGHPDYARAREIGAALGRDGCTIITGGGPGLMEAANRGARDVGARSVGLSIDLPFHERENPYLDLRVRFHYFFARKVCFVRYAMAFVVMPGGFGTLDELFEALVLIQTGKVRDFPVLVVDGDVYDPLWVWVRERLAGGGFISPGDPDLVTFCDGPEAVVNCVRRAAAAQDARAA